MFSLHWFYCLSCTEGTLVIKKRKQSNSYNMFCIEGSLLLLLFFTLLFILNVAMFLRKLKQKKEKKQDWIIIFTIFVSWEHTR